MSILLICKYETGSVGLNAARIDGIQFPDRLYKIVNHQVVLEGDDLVIRHDTEELLAMGDLYRMPTPGEQDVMTKAKQDASAVQESAPKSKKTAG